MKANRNGTIIDMVLPLYTSESTDDNVRRSVHQTPGSDCADEYPQSCSSVADDDEFNDTGTWNNHNEEERPPNQGVGQSSLLKNITDCNIEAVRHCLQTGKGAGHLLAPWLFVAAEAGNEQVFSLLVNCGFNPNKRLKHGQAPIHYAAYYGNVSIVQFLIRSGQSLDLKDAMSNTPIHYAVDTRRDNRNMIEFLVQSQPSEKMASGFLNNTSNSGSSPLLIAIWRRNFEHVKCLCELGAIPRFDDCRMAVLKHDVKILLYLLQRNSPLAEDKSASTATRSQPEIGEEESLLHLACEIENPSVRSQIVHTLLACGYEVRRNFQWICDSEMSVFQKHKGKTLYNYHRRYITSVNSLAHLACVKIRQHMGQSLPSVVDRLPVPEPVKDLIKLTDRYDSIVQDTTAI